MNAHTAWASLGLSIALVAAPASAVEALTGTWQGKLKCKTLLEGTTGKSKVEQAITILDTGAEGLLIRFVAMNETFVGFVVADDRKPNNGVLSAMTCGLVFGSAPSGSFLRVEVKTGVGQVKASLKGDVIQMDFVEQSSQTCSLSAKRVSDEPPDIAACGG